MWTGLLLLALAAPASLAAQPTTTTTLSGQTEVARLVDLASQRLKIRIEYDPAQLKGPVTVRGADEGGIPDQELWETVNSALAGRGFTIVAATNTPTGRDRPGARQAFTVVKLADAAAAVIPEGPFEGNKLQWSGLPPGFAAVFLHVEHKSLKSVADILKPVLSKVGSSIIPVGDSDLLLVADLVPRLRLAADFLTKIDVALAPTEVAEVSLSHISAAEVIAFVKDMSGKRDTAGQRPPGDVLPQPGTNGVFILAPKEHIAFWKDLIARLDARQPAETRNYTSRQVDAKALAKLVEQVAGVENTNLGRESDTKVVVDEFTGTLIVTATPAQHARVTELLSRIDSAPGGPPKQVKTFPIRNRPVREVLSVLNELLAAGRVDNSGPLLPRSETGVRHTDPAPENTTALKKESEDRVHLTADEGTNSIIVVSEPRLLGQVEELLKTLDVRQPQVMIEVVMISLSDGQSLALGVALDKIGSLDGAAIRLSSIFTLAAGGSGGPPTTPGLGATASYIRAGDFTAILRAYQAINKGRAASLPSVLVGNNQQATFTSVAQQPTSTVTTDVTSTTTRGFGGFQDAGTRIHIKPQIAEGDHLVLTYNVELSSFTGKAQDGLPGARQQNTVTSVAMIPDGFAVVVGGLEFTTDTEDTSQVPLLGDIPFLGELFKSRSTTNDRTRFFVFIRANIMRDYGFEDLKYVSARTNRQEGVGIAEDWPTIEPRVIK